MTAASNPNEEEEPVVDDPKTLLLPLPASVTVSALLPKLRLEDVLSLEPNENAANGLGLAASVVSFFSSTFSGLSSFLAVTTGDELKENPPKVGLISSGAGLDPRDAVEEVAEAMVVVTGDPKENPEEALEAAAPAPDPNLNPPPAPIVMTVC